MHTHLTAIYVAGAYTAHTPAGIDANIAHAAAAAVRLIKAGYSVICPHTNTMHFEREIPNIDVFYRMDHDLIYRCDAIYMLSNWLRSRGAKSELAVACWLGKDIFFEGQEEPPEAEYAWNKLEYNGDTIPIRISTEARNGSMGGGL